MRRLVEDNQDAFDGLMGEYVALWCCRYIYAGRLIAVNDRCVKLADAKLVYETGELDKRGFKDAQALPADWYVMLQSIESFGLMS